jgi:hypothetical protein
VRRGFRLDGRGFVALAALPFTLRTFARDLRVHPVLLQSRS